MKIRKQSKKCIICGKPTSTHKARFCRRCALFGIRLKGKRLPAKTVKAIWNYIRKYGYVCYYTGMILDMDHPNSPWYLEFDHWKPQDDRKVVLTTRLFNEMKTDLSEDEFWYYVDQLDSHRKNGTKVHQRALKYWCRLLPPEVEPFQNVSQGYPVQKKYYKKCLGCGKAFRVYVNSQKYCPVCDKFTIQMELDRLKADVIKQIWAYVRKNGYVCYYSGMPLDMQHPMSAWYVSYDHWIPHNNKRVVLTNRLFNEMKTELSENEFWYFIDQLNSHRKYGTKVKKRRLLYWTKSVSLRGTK